MVLRSAKRKHQPTQTTPVKRKTAVQTSAEIARAEKPRLDLTTDSELQIEMRDAAHQLSGVIATEKEKTARFDEFLRSALAEDHPKDLTFIQCFGSPFTPDLHALGRRISVLDKVSGDRIGDLGRSRIEGVTVEDDLDLLSETLSSQRQADKLYEIKLRSYLTDA